MECNRVRQLLPGYLDDALPSDARSETHLMVGQHLQHCRECCEELQEYIELSSLMSRVQRSAPPTDLALRIRIAVAQRLADNPRLHYTRLARNRAHMILKNILEPLALPATAGFTVALVVFVLVCQVLGMGVPLRAVTNDSPTNLLQPARLEALAPFPITGLEESGHAGPHALLVNATIDAEGGAVTYEILSGPDNPKVRRQLDQVFLFSRFRPQMSFGRFMSGGHVVLSFSDISVKG
jgi:hypothetical protein